MGSTLGLLRVGKTGRKAPLSTLRATENTRSRPIQLFSKQFLRGDEVRFEPRRLEALGTPVPQRFTQDLLQGASFAYPLELSFGKVSSVELREDRLVLTGEVITLPVG